MNIILASASPRRAELLKMMGLPFTVLMPEIDETPQKNESPDALTLRLAEEKAHAVCPSGDAVIIAADTVVSLENAILGKPRDEADALAMLQSLNGKKHWVYTGLAMRRGEAIFTRCVKTQVTMARNDASVLRAYVASGEPFGKAGSYGIQGRGGMLIEHINGDFYGVVGLPIHTVYQGLMALGLGVFQFWA